MRRGHPAAAILAALSRQNNFGGEQDETTVLLRYVKTILRVILYDYDRRKQLMFRESESS